MNHIPTIMPTKARVVSDGKMEAMKRLLVGDVPTNLAGMSIYAFGFPFFFAFGPPQGDGAVLLTSLMMAGLWTGLMRGGPILPKLIVPDLAGNKRVFRMLPVRGDDWADAVWAQRVVIPFGILAVLSVPCLLIAALLGKLDTALWCRTLSNLALACVFLCAGRQLLAATMQKRRSTLVAAFVWLFGVFAILADLSIMGYVSLSLFLSPVGASAAVALGLLTFGHSFLTRREMCADPVLEAALAVAERPCEISAGSPLKRFFNGCQPFLGFASMMLFLNLL